MFRLSSAMFVAGVCATLATAQAPANSPGQGAPASGAPQAAPPAHLRAVLTEVLQGWETDSAAFQNLAVRFDARRKVNGMERRFDGTAKFIRLPQNLLGAILQMDAYDARGQRDPDRDERYVCTGANIYVINRMDKIIYWDTLPANSAGNAGADGPMPFFVGMKAADAETRYDLVATQSDAWYTYIDVRPKWPKDKLDFVYARLVVLNKQTSIIPKGLPRELYWVEPNKVEVKWEIKEIVKNTSDPKIVNRAEFVPPPLPPGWKAEKMQKQSPAAPLPPPPGNPPPAGSGRP